MSALTIQPLTNAVIRLQEGWQRYLQDTSDMQIRDGLIQRFKFTYEISHKILKRYLENAPADPTQFDLMSFQDIIRTANEQNLLLGNWADWKQYRDMRARTRKKPRLPWCKALRNFLRKRNFYSKNFKKNHASRVKYFA